MKKLKIPVFAVIILVLVAFWLSIYDLPFVNDYPIVRYVLWTIAIACLLFNTIRDIKMMSKKNSKTDI